jgi:hypothetical protein
MEEEMMDLFDEDVIELARSMIERLSRVTGEARALHSTIGWLCANDPDFKSVWNATSKERRREWMREVSAQ